MTLIKLHHFSRRKFLLPFSLGLSVVICLLGRPAAWADDAAPKVTRVACIGDSIVFGAGLADREHNNWPTVLGGWLGAG